MGRPADLLPGTRWPRPVPTIGDTTSAAQRAGDPAALAFDEAGRELVHRVIATRRDVRRYRPDEVLDDVLRRVLAAAHAAPSVGHSQPWRFVIVRDPATRERAAWLADRHRIAQAAAMPDDAARQLLDLQLDGIREAPLGIVVCCDRRSAPAGVLGRATFHDADLWSCACAIQNLWLAARAEGLGAGWVTLFEPAELAALVGLPDGVATLGWVCLGFPDERQPGPGLERAGWSARLPLDDVVLAERWSDAAPPPPPSRIRAPEPASVVAARDGSDELLTAPRSFGILDLAIDRVVARCGPDVRSGVLVLTGGDHPVADLGVTPYARSVTADVLAAARAGTALGAAAARAGGLELLVVEAGASAGDLATTDALPRWRVDELLDAGRRDGAASASRGLVALGEVGVGNTTVAAAVSAALLCLPPARTVGLGSGADSAMLARKRDVVGAALARRPELVVRPSGGAAVDPLDVVSAFGGPELAHLAGVTLGVAAAGGVVVLDGLLTSLAALVACTLEPAVAAHLVAGQRSREAAHAEVLGALGLEPLLDLRLRAGEGVGAVLATRLLLDGLAVRRTAARVDDRAGATL